MAHGGHRKHRMAGKPMRDSSSGRKGLRVKCPLEETKIKKKTKAASIKNQIRSIERLLKKNLPSEVQDAQKQRLEDLKKQAEEHQRAELERKMSLRYRRVKFFERRKIERHIKRLEKLQEGTDATGAVEISNMTTQLVQLKEDLEYVRFFPRTKKYVSLFMGNEDEEVIAKRSKLREQIKANLAAAAASGVAPEEMDSDEDPATAVSDDDFFLAGGSSDDGEADDQFTLTSSKPGAIRNQTMNTAKASANHTSGHKKQQMHKIPQNSGSGSKIHKQRSGPMLKNKGSWWDDRRHHSVGADNRNKGSRLDDQMHHSIGGHNKIKESMGSQKPKNAKFAHPSSISSSTRSQPAWSSTLKTVSSVILPNPFHLSADVIKAPTVPEFSSSNMDAQKKRRRKHRPKKKKS